MQEIHVQKPYDKIQLMNYFVFSVFFYTFANSIILRLCGYLQKKH